MNILQEKLARSVSNFSKTYRVKPGDYKQLFVVFEFECFLEMGENEPDYVERNYETADDPEQYLSYLEEYFNTNKRTLNKIKQDYEQWFEDQIEDRVVAYQKKHPQENYLFVRHLLKRQYADEFPIARFFKEDFKNFRKLCDHYHVSPYYEWVTHDDYGDGDENSFYTEDYSDFDNDEESAFFAAMEREFPKPVKIFPNSSGPEIKDPDYWYIVRDSSLDGDAMSGYVSVEIVSAWIPGDEALETLDWFKTFFDEYNGLTSKKTGGHINIRLAEKNKIDWLKLFLLSHEYSDLLTFKRDSNQYCQSVMKLIKERFSDRLPDEKEFLKNPQSLEIFANIIRRGFNSNKYHSINLEKFFDDRDVKSYPTHREGFVEFRIPGFDYLGSRFPKYRQSLVKYMNLMLASTIGNPTFDSEFRIRLIRLYNTIKSRTEYVYSQHLHKNFDLAVAYLARTASLVDCTKQIFSGLRYLNKTQSQESIPTVGDKFDTDEITHYQKPRVFTEKNIWISAAIYKLITNKTDDGVGLKWLNSVVQKNQTFPISINIINTLNLMAVYFPELKEQIKWFRNQIA